MMLASLWPMYTMRLYQFGRSMYARLMAATARVTVNFRKRDLSVLLKIV